MSSQIELIWLLIIIAASALTLGLMAAWRRYWKRHGLEADLQQPKVYVFGAVSPILSWLKGGWLRFRKDPPWGTLKRLWATATAPLPSQPSSTPTKPPPQVPDERQPAMPPAATSVAAASPRPQVHVQVSVEAPGGMAVQVTVESFATGESRSRPALGPRLLPSRARASAATARPLLADRGTAAVAWLIAVWQRLSALLRARAISLEGVLFGLGLAIYLFTRLVGLEQFPIYFFSDEAIQTVLASDFVRDGFRNYADEFLPTYFPNGSFYNLSVSVYAQVIPHLLFGYSVFVTRAVTVAFALLAAAWVGLILKRIFKLPYWWAGVLLLSIAPAWFLHSRTAFETAIMTALYAGFLYYYLRYRQEAPRYLYAALVLGALAFYAYSPGQIVIVVSGMLFLVSDWRYHWKHRATAWRGAVLLALLALPYVRFRLVHAEAAYTQLRERGSYWVDPKLTTAAKVAHAVSEYTYGLSPAYWYFPNGRDISRHVMAGYGNLPAATLPLALLGLAWALKEIRSPTHRAVLLAGLAAPAGSLLAEVGVTRVLMFVIPATLLAAAGLSLTLRWLERFRLSRRAASWSVFVLLAGANVWMTRDALVNGPLWFRDYGLDGMQFGAQPLFGEAIPRYLQTHPGAQVNVSPTWANGTEVFLPFFLSPSQWARVQLRNIDYYLQNQAPLDANTVLVMTPDEYAQAQISPKFKPPQVDQILPFPDGSPGFYFVHLAYADNAAALFAAERVVRRQLVSEAFVLDGQAVTVTHSPFGAGSLADVFDGDPFTLARGVDANPLILEVAFPQPRPITAVKVTVGTMKDFTITLSAYAEASPTPVVYQENYRNLSDDPTVTLGLNQGPPAVSKLHLEIKYNLGGDTAQIHVRELEFH